ncbi:MAG: pentapeptide repeat-containing protein [Cyanobacteria bacterium P01_F01_bin.116]
MQDSKQNKTTEDVIREIANRLYQNRHSTGDLNDSEMYLAEARRIFKNPVRRQLFNLKERFIWLEKRKIEPLADWLDQADVFRVIEKLSPIVEAAGVLLIPVLLFLAAQRYEKQQAEQQEIIKASQEAQAKEQRNQELALQQRREVTDYWNQVLTILTDVEGDLRSPQNAQIRSFISAITFDLLHDNDLDGDRKGDVVRVISQAGLIQPGEGKNSDIRIIDLSNTELKNINLSEINFKGANFRGVNLSGTDLSDTDLSGADLSGADLSDTDLSGADLRGATVEEWQLENAVLCETHIDESLGGLLSFEMKGRLVTTPDAQIEEEEGTHSNRDCPSGFS